MLVMATNITGPGKEKIEEKEVVLRKQLRTSDPCLDFAETTAEFKCKQEENSRLQCFGVRSVTKSWSVT